MFIGYYSLANFVTTFGLLSSVLACFLAAHGNLTGNQAFFKISMVLLFFACVCDLFDGTIARAHPTKDEKRKIYGIQLDSICDVVSFGVAPCFVAYSMGYNSVIDVLVYLVFSVCGAIRLSYFNTLALATPGKPTKYYRGLPIPVSCFFFAFNVLLTTFIPTSVTVWLFRLFFLVFGLAFIINIRVKKQPIKVMMIIGGVQILMLLIIVIAGLKLPIFEA